MKDIAVKDLVLSEVKVVRFSRYNDNRGYFTETYRKSDFEKVDFLKGVNFTQINESHSKKGVIRGLHFQWNPYMSKLVRTVEGHMVDLFLDIRQASPTYGKIAAYDMPSDPEQDYDEWIWIPVGFAHGNFYPEDSTIEYLCTGEYSPDCEIGISPLASDIDWSYCDPKLKDQFNSLKLNATISSKDKEGLTLEQWKQNPNSQLFSFPKS